MAGKGLEACDQKSLRVIVVYLGALDDGAMPELLQKIGNHCRLVTAALIAGPWPGRDLADVEAALSKRPASTQALVVAGVLAMLAALSFFAGQFGLLGLAVFWLAVILIVA